MIETQLKQLIKSIDLTNEILTTLINKHALGGQDVKPDNPEATRAEQPATPGSTKPQAGPADKQSNPAGSQPPSPAPDSPVEDTAAVAAAQSLQARIMAVSQATSNPMLGMQFLAQFKLTSFDELSSEQMEQTDKQLVEIAASAGVKL